MDRKKKHSLAYYCYVNEAKSLQCMIINGSLIVQLPVTSII